jgi:hypothetical protein
MFINNKSKVYKPWTGGNLNYSFKKWVSIKEDNTSQDQQDRIDLNKDSNLGPPDAGKDLQHTPELGRYSKLKKQKKS